MLNGYYKCVKSSSENFMKEGKVYFFKDGKFLAENCVIYGPYSSAENFNECELDAIELAEPRKHMLKDFDLVHTSDGKTLYALPFFERVVDKNGFFENDLNMYDKFLDTINERGFITEIIRNGTTIAKKKECLQDEYGNYIETGEEYYCIDGKIISEKGLDTYLEQFKCTN